MRYILWGLFWIGVYLCVVLAPQFVLLIGTTPAGNGFWWDFSGYIRVSQLPKHGHSQE